MVLPEYSSDHLRNNNSKHLPENFGRGKTFSNFNVASIILKAKPDRDSTRRLQTNTPHEHRHKNPQKNITNLDSAIYINAIPQPNGRQGKCAICNNHYM